MFLARSRILSKRGLTAGAAVALVAGTVLFAPSATAASLNAKAYRTSELKAVTAQLDKSARIAGTAWRIDPRSGRVLVTADPTVTGAALDRLNSVMRGFGDKVSFKRTSGKLRPFIGGGDAIWGQGLRC